MNIYECPYCKENKYKRRSKGIFTSWKAVQGHSRKCNYNTGEYYIDLYYGPIHYSNIIFLPIVEIITKYPKINRATDVITLFRRRDFLNKNNTISLYKHIEYKLKLVLKKYNIVDSNLLNNLLDLSNILNNNNSIDNRLYSKKFKKIFRNIMDKPLNVSWNVYWLYKIGYKKCSCCNNIQHINNFSELTSSWNNKDYICKKCRHMYYKNNKARYLNYSATRRANKIRATIKFLSHKDKELIKNYYISAVRFNKELNKKFHVDHIVPLQGENVCGLHVPWNLQIIQAKENLIKGNKCQ